MLPPWVNPFLDAYARIGVIAKAARSINIKPQAVYSLKRDNEAFETACAEAHAEAVDGAEAEAWRRGKDGYDEPVIYAGEPSYHPARDERGDPIYDIVQEETIDAEGAPRLQNVRRLRLALDGEGRPIPVAVKKHSDALLLAILKAHRKPFSTDRVEHTDGNGNPAFGALDETAKAARVAALIELARTRKDVDDFV